MGLTSFLCLRRVGFQIGVWFEEGFGFSPSGEMGEGFMACYNLIHAKEEEVSHSTQEDR